MKNTSKNKERFFALYWGQEVLRYGKIKMTPQRYFKEGWTTKGVEIELTPLSQITDEDAYWLAKKSYIEDWINRKGREDVIRILKTELKNNCLSTSISKSDTVDYLRSKGYALLFEDVDVETLIEWGWVKLKQ